MVQVALLFTALCTLVLGFLVFLNNPRSTLFRLNFAFGISSALWMLVNALVVANIASISDHTLLLISQCITPLSLLTSFIFYLFLKLFSTTQLTRRDLMYAIPTIGVSLFSFTSYNVAFNAQGELVLGAMYPVYLAALLFNIFLLIYVLYNKKSMRLAKIEAYRQQIRYLRIGVLASIIPAIFFGAIVPIFSSSSISDIGPLFSICFIIASSIAIVKHKLFEIRTFVVRALIYLLTTGGLAAVYVAPIVYFITSVIFGLPIYPLQFILIVIIGTIVATNYARLKNWFDSATSKIFFRDVYDSARLLGELNKILVTSPEINKMLHASARLIYDNIKPDFSIFALKETANTDQRTIGLETKRISGPAVTALLHNPKLEKLGIIATELLPADMTAEKKALAKANVAVMVRLSETEQKGGDNLGYILLGYKKSGNPYTTQDFETLESMADVMVIAIQNALRFEEIQRFNVTLQRRIDEATAELRRANERLKTLDETKDDFISMASHQLRTPLTSVKGYLSMVLEGDAGKLTAMQRKMLDQAFVSSQRMVFLISDLLNISRLKTGKFVIDPSKINLANMVSEEVRQLQETAKTRSLELVFDKPDGFPDLMLDETKTRQVIMNYIDNAIYYTPAGGKIEIALSDRPDAIELKVSDNGIGVPKSEQQHLFTKFYRAGNARRTRPDGTGLGLFMAKKVIIAQGGAVIFDSKEGKGSTFGFALSKTKVLPKST